MERELIRTLHLENGGSIEVYIDWTKIRERARLAMWRKQNRSKWGPLQLRFEAAPTEAK